MNVTWTINNVAKCWNVHNTGKSLARWVAITRPDADEYLR